MKETLKRGLRLLPMLALGIFPLAACGGGEEAQEAPAEGTAPGAQPMSQEVQTLVAQGNEAHREGNYEQAMVHYRAAMEQAPGHPVPEFGALMAAMALGQTELADSLRNHLAVTAPELVGMLNPDGTMGAMPADPHQGMPGLPTGHPDITGAAPDTMQQDTSGTR